MFFTLIPCSDYIFFVVHFSVRLCVFPSSISALPAIKSKFLFTLSDDIMSVLGSSSVHPGQTESLQYSTAILLSLARV